MLSDLMYTWDCEHVWCHLEQFFLFVSQLGLTDFRSRRCNNQSVKSITKSDKLGRAVSQERQGVAKWLKQCSSNG